MSHTGTTCLALAASGLGILFSNSLGALSDVTNAYQIMSDSGYHDIHDKVLHRLLLVHFYAGTMNVGGGRELLEEGLRRATKSDALKTRYGFLEAAGLWALETGDLEAAGGFLNQAEEVMRSAPEVSDKVHMFAHLGELCIAEGRREDAIEYYLKARASLHPQHAWRAHETVYGGLGYCALELGDLQLVRECDALLRYSNEGYFDPWVIVLFRATMAKRRGEQERAADYALGLAKRFEGRLQLVTIKLRLLECRLMPTTSHQRIGECLNWLESETRRLELPIRLAEVKSLQKQKLGMRTSAKICEA